MVGEVIIDLRKYLLANLPQVVPKLSEYWAKLNGSQQEALSAFLFCDGDNAKASSRSGLDVAIIEWEASRFKEFVGKNAPLLKRQIKGQLSEEDLSVNVRNEYGAVVRHFYKIMGL